jgi:hypothetical protein
LSKHDTWKSRFARWSAPCRPCRYDSDGQGAAERYRLEAEVTGPGPDTASPAAVPIRQHACVPEPLRIRQPTALRAYIGGFGVFWCVLVSVGFFGLAPRPEALIPLGMLAFGGSLTYRMFRLEAVADDGGLLIRNYYKTRRYSWGEIEDFRLGSPMLGMPFGKVIHALLVNGEIVTLDVTMMPALLGRGRKRRENHLRQLQEWVART